MTLSSSAFHRTRRTDYSQWTRTTTPHWRNSGALWLVTIWRCPTKWWGKLVFHKVFNPLWDKMSQRRSLFVDAFKHCGLYPPQNPMTSADFQVNALFSQCVDIMRSPDSPANSLHLLRTLAPSPRKEGNPTHLKLHNALITFTTTVAAFKENKNKRATIENKSLHQTEPQLKKIRSKQDCSTKPCCSSSIQQSPKDSRLLKINKDNDNTGQHNFYCQWLLSGYRIISIRWVGICHSFCLIGSCFWDNDVFILRHSKIVQYFF